MKKLMIAAAIVCAAAFAQAATMNWNADYLTNSEGGETGVYGFLVLSSANYVEGATPLNYALDAATQSIVNNHDASFLSTYALANGSGTQGFAVGGGGNVSGLGIDAGGKEILAKNQMVTGYVILLDSATIADATKACILSVDAEGAALTGNINGSGGVSKSISLGDLYDTTADPGNWHTVGAVPEPTSGLLLLIGVAGLALRRRRA